MSRGIDPAAWSPPPDPVPAGAGAPGGPGRPERREALLQAGIRIACRSLFRSSGPNPALLPIAVPCALQVIVGRVKVRHKGPQALACAPRLHQVDEAPALGAHDHAAGEGT